MQQIKLEIPNMKCEGCYQKIAKLFKKNKHIKLIDKNFTNRQIILEYNPNKITIQEIKNLLTKIGY